MKTFWAILGFLVYYVNTDLGGCPVLALAGSPLQDDSESIRDPEGDAGMPPEMLQELLWFFRTDDSPAWSYSILALSFMVLLIGAALLATSMKANKNKKLPHLHKDGYEDRQPDDETEMKQGFVPLKEGSNSDGPAENLLPKAQNEGQVMITWKDGDITTLYPAVPEEDV